MSKRAIGAIVALALSAAAAAAEDQPVLSGNIFIHDPSVVVIEGTFASFATGVERAADGGTPRTKSSPDGLTWTETGALQGGQPEWIADALGRMPPNLWAPSISEYEGTHYLYYAASTFGSNNSAIGLMTNDAFDATDPATGWRDQGMVLRSHRSDAYNAIDPFRIDTEGGAWLAFGSFWDGIHLVEIDPRSGKRIDDAEPLLIASRHGGAIEAPAILEHDGGYFLFVSFGHCCRGVASDYRIMVGRSDAVTGPYRAKDGADMREGGATEVLASDGRYRGPGGQEAFMGPDGPMLAYHYYDAAAGGRPKLGLAPLSWDAEGWPVIGPFPEAEG
ncbi:arabinan endo-1,5-alpha-L-arabinosidase [Pelagibacterium halotolerans]|uniref:arabinan endo-1,5-alpha-L-arabinosidase n=1 Tax=Pelagibacterium halotolerans TaxID=531813 RepID=UPI0038504ABB